jgi:hypothetical protein
MDFTKLFDKAPLAAPLFSKEKPDMSSIHRTDTEPAIQCFSRFKAAWVTGTNTFLLKEKKCERIITVTYRPFKQIYF